MIGFPCVVMELNTPPVFSNHLAVRILPLVQPITPRRTQFYNMLTTNCTTPILMHSHVNPDHLPFSWKVLLSGYVPEYVYDAGRLDTSLPFSELFRQSHINARAQAADQAPDFSRDIRRGLPPVDF